MFDLIVEAKPTEGLDKPEIIEQQLALLDENRSLVSEQRKAVDEFRGLVRATKDFFETQTKLTKTLLENIGSH